MKNVIYIVLALIAAAVAAYFMIVFVGTPIRQQQYWHLAVSVISLLIAIALGGIYFASRVNQEEELHITK